MPNRDLALRAAGESIHAYSRAVTWVWAAILAMDRGEVAEFRRHALALAADSADEGPAQVRLAAELFAGHLAILDGRTERGLTRMRTVRAQLVSAQAPAPGLPGVATRLLLEGYTTTGQPEPGLALAHEALAMVSTGCVVVTAPPEEFVPPELRGRPVLGIPVLYVGDPEAGAAAVQPLRDLGPAVDHIGPMPYTAFQAALDPLAPWDLGGFYARGEYIPGLSDAAIEVFLAHATDLVTLSPPFSQMIIFRIGQGVAAVPSEATAFPRRDARYLFHPITAWLDSADGEKMIAATRAFAAAMRPFSTGASYLNFTHEADRVRDAYGDATYARLVALKDTYDPANLFRLNQNIRPSQSAAEPALA